MTSFSVYNDKTFNVLTTNSLNHDTLTGSALLVNNDLGIGGNLNVGNTATFRGPTTVTGNILTGQLNVPTSVRFATGGALKFFTALGPSAQLPAAGRLVPGVSTYGECATAYNTIIAACSPGRFNLLA